MIHQAQGGDRAARDALVEQNLGLVRKIANRLRRRAGLLVELDDLVQEGIIGLLSAIDLFDIERDSRFSTYAGVAIERRILTAIDRAAPIYLPPHIAAIARQVGKATARLEATTGSPPTAEAIAQVVGIESAVVEKIVGLPVVALSLDCAGGDGEEDRLADLLPSTEPDGPAAVLEGVWVEAVLALLQPRERRILQCRLGLDGGSPESLDLVARRLRMSREGVRQREQGALAKLRAALTEAADGDKGGGVPTGGWKGI